MENRGTKISFSDAALEAIALIEKLQPRKASDSTLKGYVVETNRTIAKMALATPIQTTAKEFFSYVKNTRSKSTYTRRVAAANHYIEIGLKRCIAALSSDSDEKSLDSIQEILEFLFQLKEILKENSGQCPIDSPRPRHSKRKMIAKISKKGDFRLLLHKEFLNSKYLLPFLLSAVTGIRPDELERGITIQLNDSTLKIPIAGSKVKVTQGQELRILSYDIDNPAGHVFLKEIAQIMREKGVTEMTVQVKSKVSFTSAIRRAGQKIWPNSAEDVTPYVLRHAVASQWKQGIDPDDVSIGLGHLSPDTKSVYGQAQILRGAGMLKPASVSGNRPLNSVSRPRKRPG